MRHPVADASPRREATISAYSTNASAVERAGQPPSSSSACGVSQWNSVAKGSIVTPQLTTVRQPLAEMGRTAVSLLIRLLEHQSFETLNVQLATRLVVRESTAPPHVLAATA